MAQVDLAERVEDEEFVYRTTPWLWLVKHRAMKRTYPALLWARHRWGLVDAAKRSLPDFLIIGAMKCGTSSLYRALSVHPDMKPAIKKEIRYFNQYFDRDQRWYRAFFPRMRDLNGGHSHMVTGEATPGYLLDLHAPRRARSLVPNAKILVMLRNPVDRAYSHYFHVFPHFEDQPFSRAIALEAERLEGELERVEHDETYRSTALSRHSYLERGRYAEQLERWLQHFPMSQIKVIRSEDYFRDTAAVYNEVLDFLGLEARAPARHKRRLYPSYPPMAPAIREALVDYFRPHNERLYALLDRDLGWDR